MYLENIVSIAAGAHHMLALDKNGSVWATFPQMKQMAANYGIEDNPVIGKMQELLEKIVIKSASQY